MMDKDPKDVELDDPQINALTTPDLDGDDIRPVDDAEIKPEPADGDRDTPEARPA